MYREQYPQRRLPVGFRPFLYLLAVVMVGLVVRQIYFTGPPDRFDPDAEPRAITPRGNLAEDEQSTIELFRQASPSVVHITNLERARHRLTMRIMDIPKGTGSGIIWDNQGYVVTNYHVIEGGSSYRVTLADHTTYEAIPVGGIADKDLAVLRIVDYPEDKLRPVPIGTSNDLQVGQKVFAIGNPFGLDQTLTTGVISGLDREIKSVTNVPIRGVIQTDAAINPGNSGGALLDSAGRLIGMNTAIYSPTKASAGIGFAVPVNIINRLVPLIIKNKQPERAGLGVYPLEARISRLILRNERVGKGVLFRDIRPGSAAETAGLRPTRYYTGGKYRLGDVLLAIDDETVDEPGDLSTILGARAPGDRVTLKVLRDGRRMEVPVVLQVLSQR